MVVMLDHCCCGCTLKTGTIIIAVLQTLASLSMLGSSIKMATGQEEISSAVAKQLGFNEQQKDVYNSSVKAGVIFGIIAAIMSVINLILSIMLIMGANNESPRLVKPWLVYAVVCQVLSCILYIILAIFWMAIGLITPGIILLIIEAIVCAIAAYFILVVYSFYRQMLGVPSKI